MGVSALDNYVGDDIDGIGIHLPVLNGESDGDSGRDEASGFQLMSVNTVSIGRACSARFFLLCWNFFFNAALRCGLFGWTRALIACVVEGDNCDTGCILVVFALEFCVVLQYSCRCMNWFC